MKSPSSGMELGIVAVVLVVGALAVIPNKVGRRGHSSTNACIANLKQIQGALEMYGLENQLTPTNRVSIGDISGGADKFIGSRINADLVCPQGGTYSITTVVETPRCSVPGHTI
jgi:type II secretory pathway pseudopilin PulG